MHGDAKTFIGEGWSTSEYNARNWTIIHADFGFEGVKGRNELLQSLPLDVADGPPPAVAVNRAHTPKIRRTGSRRYRLVKITCRD